MDKPTLQLNLMIVSDVNSFHFTICIQRAYTLLYTITHSKICLMKIHSMAVCLSGCFSCNQTNIIIITDVVVVRRWCCVRSNAYIFCWHKSMNPCVTVSIQVYNIQFMVLNCVCCMCLCIQQSIHYESI